MNANSTVREIRVARSTYFVIGFFAAIPLFAGVGGLAGKEPLLGLACLIAAPALFYYFCFQKIILDGDALIYRRPFRAEQRIQLSSITQVRTVWSNGSEGGYRKLHFLSGEQMQGAFNPKPFSLADLKLILEEVQTYAPEATIDDAAKRFLRANVK
jgi:hypothetical protein